MISTRSARKHDVGWGRQTPLKSALLATDRGLRMRMMSQHHARRIGVFE